jgi:hypothetical protein
MYLVPFLVLALTPPPFGTYQATVNLPNLPRQIVSLHVGRFASHVSLKGAINVDREPLVRTSNDYSVGPRVSKLMERYRSEIRSWKYLEDSRSILVRLRVLHIPLRIHLRRSEPKRDTRNR